MQSDISETAAKLLSVDSSVRTLGEEVKDQADNRQRLTNWIRDNIGPNLEHIDARAAKKSDDDAARIMQQVKALLEAESHNNAIELRRARLEDKTSLTTELQALESRFRSLYEASIAEHSAHVETLFDSFKAEELKILEEKTADMAQKLQHLRGELVDIVERSVKTATKNFGDELAEERAQRMMEGNAEKQLITERLERVAHDTRVAASAEAMHVVTEALAKLDEDTADARLETAHRIQDLQRETERLRKALRCIAEEVNGLSEASAGNSDAETLRASLIPAMVLGGTNAEDVRLWLTGRGLGAYLAGLEQNGFLLNAQAFSLLDENVLDVVGVKLPGHRKALLVAALEMKKWLTATPQEREEMQKLKTVKAEKKQQCHRPSLFGQEEEEQEGKEGDEKRWREENEKIEKGRQERKMKLEKMKEEEETRKKELEESLEKSRKEVAAKEEALEKQMKDREEARLVAEHEHQERVMKELEEEKEKVKSEEVKEKEAHEAALAEQKKAAEGAKKREQIIAQAKAERERKEAEERQKEMDEAAKKLEGERHVLECETKKEVVTATSTTTSVAPQQQKEAQTPVKRPSLFDDDDDEEKEQQKAVAVPTQKPSQQQQSRPMPQPKKKEVVTVDDDKLLDEIETRTSNKEQLKKLVKPTPATATETPAKTSTPKKQQQQQHKNEAKAPVLEEKKKEEASHQNTEVHNEISAAEKKQPQQQQPRPSSPNTPAMVHKLSEHVAAQEPSATAVSSPVQAKKRALEAEEKKEEASLQKHEAHNETSAAEKKQSQQKPRSSSPAPAAAREEKDEKPLAQAVSSPPARHSALPVPPSHKTVVAAEPEAVAVVPPTQPAVVAEVEERERENEYEHIHEEEHEHHEQQSAGGSHKAVNAELVFSEELKETHSKVFTGTDPTTWFIAGYSGTRSTLSLYASGTGAVEELVGALVESSKEQPEVLYAYLRVLYGENERPKFIMITLVPDSLSGMAKAKANMHKPAVEAFLQYFHTYVNASSAEEVTPRLIEDKLRAAGGAHYGRGDGGGVCGGGEDFGSMKRMAAQNFSAKGAKILTAAKGPSVTGGHTIATSHEHHEEELSEEQEQHPQQATAISVPKNNKQEGQQSAKPKKEKKKSEPLNQQPQRKMTQSPAPEEPKPQHVAIPTPAAPVEGTPKVKPSDVAKMEKTEKNEGGAFLSEYQRKKQELLQHGTGETKGRPGSTASAMADEKKKKQAIVDILKDAGAIDDDGNVIALFGDVKSAASEAKIVGLEAVLNSMKQSGTVDFPGSSLDEDTIVTLLVAKK